MGFFGFDDRPAATAPQRERGVSHEFLHKAECSACPLSRGNDVKCPKMKARGARDADLYFLMLQPDQQSDNRKRPFEGDTGRLVRDRIPVEIEQEHARFGYIVRTLAEDGHAPTQTEIECCRPSVIRDIEDSAPRVVVGLGSAVLDWVLGPSSGGVGRWSGRYIPVKIGNHKCWFYPMLNPQDILDQRRFTPRSLDDYGCDNEFAFAVHMRQMLKTYRSLPPPVIHTEKMARKNLILVDGSEGLDHVELVEKTLNTFAKLPAVGFDYETNKLRPYFPGSKILTVGLSDGDTSLSFALHHSQHKWSDKHLRRLERSFEEWLYDAECRKLVHHLSFELEWSAFKYGPDVVRAGKWGCSVAQAYVLDEREQTHSLDFLCKQYFGIDLKDLSPLDKNNLDGEPLDKVLAYNAMDGKYHIRLYERQDERLKEEKLTSVYRHTLRRIQALVLTQLKGVPIDQSVVKQFDREVKADIAKYESLLRNMDCVQRFEKMRNEVFNPASTHHVAFILKKILKEKLDSTNEQALSTVKHKFASTMLKWRKPVKLHSVYIEPVLEGSPILFENKIHPIISTTSVRTWRTSSSDPNAQNWPKRGEGVFVRRQVTAPRGTKIVAFDYAGIQARNVAMESEDKKLVDHYWNRYDIHSDWLARLLRIYPRFVEEGVKAVNKDKDLWKAYRNIVKNKFVFPSFFGAKPKSIGQNLGIPDNKAEELWNEFADEFPDIPGWHDELKADFLKTGYVTGKSGFRRRAPIGMNQLINAPIQADEAIIVLTAMCVLSELDLDKYQPIMEIHDDLTFLWPIKEIDARADVVIREMVKPRYDWINVPLGVEMSIGDNWAELKGVGEYEYHKKSGYVDLKK